MPSLCSIIMSHACFVSMVLSHAFGIRDPEPCLPWSLWYRAMPLASTILSYASGLHDNEPCLPRFLWTWVMSSIFSRILSHVFFVSMILSHAFGLHDPEPCLPWSLWYWAMPLASPILSHVSRGLCDTKSCLVLPTLRFFSIEIFRFLDFV
jgi:hypothetical protein